MIRSIRALARATTLGAALGALAGCAALNSLTGASTPLDAYTLTPLSGAGAGGGSRHLVVELPTASGAITTDRILVTPSPLQAAYLPGARWVDSAPELIQTLVVQTLQSSGAFRLVGRTPMGLFPDNTLLTELRAFQAESGPLEGPPYVVRIAVTMTLVRDADGVIVAARNFEGSAGAGSDQPVVIAAAFDAAMDRLMRDAAPWIAATAGGGGGV